MELRISDGDKSLATAALREDRSRPGRLVVGFSADRALLDNLTVWMIQSLNGTARVIRLKDFVDLGEISVKEEESKVKRRPDPAEQD